MTCQKNTSFQQELYETTQKKMYIIITVQDKLKHLSKYGPNTKDMAKTQPPYLIGKFQRKY